MADALPTDLDYNKLNRIVKNLKKLRVEKKQEKDPFKDEGKVQCMPKVSNYIR